MSRLKGKLALITGGSRGLGRDTALRLADEGADLVITYKSNQEAAAAVVQEVQAKGVNAESMALDVLQPETIEAFAARFTQTHPKLDILINNAGAGASAIIAETTSDVIDEQFTMHFKSVYLLTSALLPTINDGGRIVMVSTGLTRFAFPGYAAYASMKGAIEVFTRYLAKEVGERGITANSVAPGAIDNDFNKARFDAAPQVKEFIASQTALGRVGVSEDVGSVTAFLCSEDARWITGQRIEVSGGMFL